MNTICKHCKYRKRHKQCRGLCPVCYEDKEIRALYPSFYPKKPWTEQEINFLKRNKQLSNKSLAEMLNRTKCSVAGARIKFNAHVYKCMDEDVLNKMKSMAEAGEATITIARKLKRHYTAIKYWLLKLGIPLKHLAGEELSESHHRGYDKTLKENDVSSLEQIKRDVTKTKAALVGWPQAETELELRILQVMNEKPPMTALELSTLLNQEKIGRPDHLYYVLKSLANRNVIKIEKKKIDTERKTSTKIIIEKKSINYYSLAVRFGKRKKTVEEPIIEKKYPWDD